MTHTTNNSDMKPMRQDLGRTYVIEGNGGTISYSTNNINLKSLMETLEEELKNSSPWELERRLKG
jgi:hypothetical protein